MNFEFIVFAALSFLVFFQTPAVFGESEPVTDVPIMSVTDVPGTDVPLQRCCRPFVKVAQYNCRECDVATWKAQKLETNNKNPTVSKKSDSKRCCKPFVKVVQYNCKQCDAAMWKEQKEDAMARKGGI